MEVEEIKGRGGRAKRGQSERGGKGKGRGGKRRGYCSKVWINAPGHCLLSINSKNGKHFVQCIK